MPPEPAEDAQTASVSPRSEAFLMSSPTSRFSKLSLESMPPTTRSQGQGQSSEAGGPSRNPGGDDDSSDRADDDYDDGPVRSPTTNLSYGVENLDDDTEELVRELFRPPPQEETPQIVLEWCGFSNDPDVYAFQLHEVVPRTIRIGSPTSRFPVPRCNCMEDPGSRPCRHLVWLMDQLTKQTVPDHDPAAELELDGRGFPRVLGSPYARITDFHVDVLADDLHCDFGPSLHHPEPNPHRVREVREMLAALAGADDDDDVDGYRPDLFDVPPLLRTADIVARGELEYTLLRLLLSNNEFFALFLKLLAPRDKVRDPYRKLRQRADRVLRDLAASSSPSAAPPPAGRPPKDVAWAAAHLRNVVTAIQRLVERGSGAGDGGGNAATGPAEAWERASAARTLVWLLKTVCVDHARDAHAGATQDDRNLYQRLVGNASDAAGAFAVDALLLLPEQNQYIDELEAVRERVHVLGYREGFMRKLDAVIANLRRRTSASAAAGSAAAGPSGHGPGAGSAKGSKRQGTGREGERDRRAAKRAR